MKQAIEKHGKVGRPKGYVMSQESKGMISKTKMGHKHPQEVKDKISDTLIKYFDKTGRKIKSTNKCKGCGKLIKIDNTCISRNYCDSCLSVFLHNGEVGDYKKTYKQLKDSKIFKLWRLKILIRDKFRCRICGKVGECVHHLIDIMKIKDIPELLYNTDIGLTLCTSCHGKVHANIRKNRVKGEE